MSTDKLVLDTNHPFFGVGLVLIDENLRREGDHDDDSGLVFDKGTSEEAIGIFGDDEWYVTGNLVEFAEAVNAAASRHHKTPEQVADAVLAEHAIQSHWQRSGDQIRELLIEAVREARK